MDVIDWVDFVIGDERLGRLVGDRAVEFSDYVACVMDRI